MMARLAVSRLMLLRLSLFGLLPLLFAPAPAFAEAPALPAGAPSFEQVISLRRVSAPAISPDGRAIAFEVRTVDWQENRYDTEIWLARAGEEPFQLTRTEKGSSTGARFSPDGRWLAFLANRGDGQQLHRIRLSGGEAEKLTDWKEGVENFRFAPDGKSVVLLREEAETKEKKKRKERYGSFAVEDKEWVPSHLWRLELGEASRLASVEARCDAKEDDKDDHKDGEKPCPGVVEPKRLTEGEAFTIADFEISPDGRRLVVERRRSAEINDAATADLAVLELETGKLAPLVERPGYDGEPRFSPDGRFVLFGSTAGNTTSDYYSNGQIHLVPVAGGELRRLAAGFDEDPSSLEWTEAGIFFLGREKMTRRLYRIDPEVGVAEPLDTVDGVVGELAVTRDGKHFALVAATPEALPEVYRLEPSSAPQVLTAMTAQIDGWPLGSREVVSWKSSDGTTIEGVLHKPPGFDPAKRYPLLVVIHGGPTGIDVPTPLPAYVYPVAQWLAKGALVLRPNYRGSAGYGEAFRSLNVRNLGVGDAWDVLSGVDALLARGIADPERLGAMGWSQGGYISAYLATTSDRFKAISVGAGISDWMTYYVNTDVHPFTRQYLRATPWDDPEIYAKTSPITFIKNAKTPTLIQHGENDRRVPVPNAYELYQGLQDVGVESKLVIYNGFGHSINKPKELLAAVEHNWEWFGRWVWGAE